MLTSSGANVTILTNSCLFFSLKCPGWRAQRRDKRERKIRCITAVSQVRVIRSILINAKFIFSFYEVTRLHYFIVSFLQTSPGEYVWLCPGRLVSKAFMWNIQYNIYEARHPTALYYSQFSVEIFDLKSQRAIEASRSWSKNNRRVFSSCRSLLQVACPSFAWQCHFCLTGSGQPLGFKDTLKFCKTICQAWTPMTITTSVHHILTKPIHECAVCCRHDGKCLLSSDDFSTVRPCNPTAASSLSLF